MQLTFLGTGAGVPSRQRNVSAVALTLEHAQRNAIWLFDCGEGTQHQFMRSALKPGRLEKIFITHLHGDHLFGLPGLLTSRSMAGVMTPLTVYGPQGIRTFIETTLSLSASWTTYPLTIVEITQGNLFSDAQIVVTARLLAHVVPCYGFRIEMRAKPGALDMARLMAAGVPSGPWLAQIKQGKRVMLPDGRQINGEDYLKAAVKGKSLAIFGDTAPTPVAVELAAGVDVMVHETTLETAMMEKANGRGHSTTVQAAQLARQAGVGRLIATHFSSRYLPNDSKRLLAECRAVFPNTELATDLACFTV